MVVLLHVLSASFTCARAHTRTSRTCHVPRAVHSFGVSNMDVSLLQPVWTSRASVNGQGTLLSSSADRGQGGLLQPALQHSELSADASTLLALPRLATSDLASAGLCELLCRHALGIRGRMSPRGQERLAPRVRQV